MVFDEDTVENGIVLLVKQWEAQLDQLPKSYEEFQKGLAGGLAELEESMTAAKHLTATQIRQIRSYVNFVQLVNDALETLKLYIRAKALADNVAIRYAKDTSLEGKRAAALGEAEIAPLF